MLLLQYDVESAIATEYIRDEIDVDDCEAESDIAIVEYSTLLPSNETTSAYTAIMDIKRNIAYTSRIYADTTAISAYNA